MSILFHAGEDCDFPFGSLPAPDTTAARFRSGYARCALGSASSNINFAGYTSAFPGGPLTNVWASCRIFIRNQASAFDNVFGLTTSTATGKGIWIQSGGSVSLAKVQLAKTDSSTTVLATETGSSFTGGTIHKLDIRIQNYGASATVTVYLDQIVVINFSGNISISGVSGLDQIGFAGWSDGNQALISEIIVADEDTRPLGLVSLIPNALGTTDQWTGTYTDVNELTLSDATVNTTNVVGQLQQYALADLPAGNFAIKAVCISARATAPAGSTSNSVQLGVQTGTGTDVGSAQAPGSSLVTLARVMNTDPTTGGQWTPATVNGMQLVMKSGA